MTYAEIKNQYKTVEEIENRINEINNILDAKDDELDEMIEKDQATLNEILKPILPENWEVTSYSPEHNLKIADKNDVWHSIYIYAKYDLEFRGEETVQKWEFSMNPSSCGTFEIFGDSKEKMYYKVIAILMTSEDVMHMLNETLHSMADNYIEFGKKNRDLRSEQKQLEILKKNIVETEQSKNILESAKSTEDKTSIVIIDKNADPEKAVGTHRGTPVTIVSLPVPNDKYEEELKKCKEMQKVNKAARYIPTQIRFIKLY